MLVLRYSYSKDDFKEFRQLTSICPENKLDEEIIHKYHLKHLCGPHRWREHRWLCESRVWFEKCARCGATRFYRVNHIVFIDHQSKVIRILKGKGEEWDMDFIRKVLKEAQENGILIEK